MSDKEISNIVDEYLKYFNNKREDYILEIENDKKDYRKLNRKELDKLLDKKLGE